MRPKVPAPSTVAPLYPPETLCISTDDEIEVLPDCAGASGVLLRPTHQMQLAQLVIRAGAIPNRRNLLPFAATWGDRIAPPSVIRPKSFALPERTGPSLPTSSQKPTEAKLPDCIEAPTWDFIATYEDIEIVCYGALCFKGDGIFTVCTSARSFP